MQALRYILKSTKNSFITGFFLFLITIRNNLSKIIHSVHVLHPWKNPGSDHPSLLANPPRTQRPETQHKSVPTAAWEPTYSTQSSVAQWPRNRQQRIKKITFMAKIKLAEKQQRRRKIRYQGRPATIALAGDVAAAERIKYSLQYLF